MSDPGNLANRGVFPNGATLERHYDLSWAETSPPITFLVFNYAIYANFNWPTGAAPYDISDFDINTANSAEAFCIKVEETANTLWYSAGSGGGAISLKAEVWDWQGDIADVGMHFYWTKLAFPHDSHFTLTGPGTTSHSYIYEANNIPFTPTATGNLDITITAVDSKTFGGSWILGLLPASNSLYGDPVYNCWLYTTTVGPCPTPIISSINPNNHLPDGIQFPATITGSNFLSGPSLAAALTKTGQSNINATNVQVTSPTQITCDLTVPDGAATGYWNVRVTNGCDTQGTGNNLFLVTSGENGPKNIELRGTGIPPWDLSVDPKSGDLFILFSDLQVWKYPASDYTTGEKYSVMKNVLLPGIPNSGWIENGPNHYTIVGFDNSIATDTPYSGWVHIEPPIGHNICGQISWKYHAFADVMAAGAEGAFPLDHFGFLGIATNPWETHIYRMDNEPTPPSPCPYDYDPPFDYKCSYPSTYYDKDSLMVSLVKGLEWDKDGNSFWAIKSPGKDSAYAARFKLNKEDIVYDDAYFGTGKPPEPGDDNGFYSPYDITRDIKNRYLVVDILPGWALRLKAWDVTTNPGTSLGGMNLTGLKGNPDNKSYRLRFDCDDNDHPEYGNILFVLHGDPVEGFFLSLYYPSELPW
jgi:hypothetical protein